MLQVLQHLVYELKKGVRSMAIYTAPLEQESEICNWLTSKRVSYLIHSPGIGKINVFLGKAECINVLRSFSTLQLNKISPEEDFILGTMLGYDMCSQCNRLCARKSQVCQSSIAS
jgi:hypothetical protein